jgi:hypothetical protein
LLSLGRGLYCHVIASNDDFWWHQCRSINK